MKLRQIPKWQNADEVFFRKTVVTVFAYIASYALAYYLLDARLSALILVVTGLVCTPVILLLDRYKFREMARMCLCSSALIYIYAASFGMRFGVQAEYYYLVALMLPALLFNPNQKRYIFFGMIFCPLVWAFQIWGPRPELSAYWAPASFPVNQFIIINFLGATVLVALFLKYFILRFHRYSTELLNISESLAEAQRVAKIGSWSLDLATGNILWSDQMFELFPENRSSGAPSFERNFSTIHPEDQAHWKQVFEKCATDGAPYRIRFRSVFCDKTLWIEAIGSAKKATDGKVLELAGTCQDISELVLAEELTKLERAKSIQSAKLASLGEMSAGIAHEINNPLTIISGNVAILSRFADDPEKLKVKSETLQRAVERISKIVNGLKKFSRTSDRNTHGPHSLSEIAKEAIFLTEFKAKRNSVLVKSNLQTDVEIYCDEIEIEQVLINLINNAIDAAKDLEERWVSVQLFERGDVVVLQVKDSGKGIDPKVQKKVFEPFFTTKDIGEGTGLGLSIVRGILDDHHATIEILKGESNTCFELTFRKVAVPTEAAAVKS